MLELTGLALAQMDVIELNEAFAAQGLAVLRDLGLADDDARVNPNGGAIALGHPLGASGARLVTTAVNQLHRSGGRYALCTMCIGVGQGIAIDRRARLTARARHLDCSIRSTHIRSDSCPTAASSAANARHNRPAAATPRRSARATPPTAAATSRAPRA